MQFSSLFTSLGWFKWGFKNSIEIIRFSLMTQMCLDSQTFVFLQANALSLWLCTIGNIHYNFYFIKSPWKLVTMAPEQHWAQVLPDLDLGSEKVTYPH